MPPELKARVEQSAKKNNRSLNAEVVFWLQKAMDEQDSIESNGIARQVPMHIKDTNIDLSPGDNVARTEMMERAAKLLAEINEMLGKETQ